MNAELEALAESVAQVEAELGHDNQLTRAVSGAHQQLEVIRQQALAVTENEIDEIAKQVGAIVDASLVIVAERQRLKQPD